jgi:hypothetical protein
MSRKLAVFCALLLISACDKEPVAPADEGSAKQLVAPINAYYAGNTMDPIAVDLNGPTQISVNCVGWGESWPCRTTYTVSVTNGTGPYYFIWKWRYCVHVGGWQWIECQNNYGGLGSGWGLDSVAFDAYEEDVKYDLLVEVYDAQGGVISGVDGMEIIGPSNYQLGFGPYSGDIGFQCSGGGYGIQEWSNGQPTNRQYRRNRCSGAREYNQ